MKAVVRTAVRAKRDELMAKRNVVGVMSGNETKDGSKTGREAVVVLVEKKVNVEDLDEQDLVPRQLDDVPTDVIEVGVIKALHKSKHRPVLPGTSIGHFAITAGTLGVVVERNGEKLILSNNHVLANENVATAGDAILQPGPADGGNANDKVAELADFVPINFTGSNLVDAALARFVGGTPPDPDPDPEPPTPPSPPDDDEENSSCPVANFLAKVINLPAKLLGRQTRLKAVRPKTVVPQEVEVKASATEGVEYDNTPLNLGVTITRDVAEVSVGDTVQKSGRTTGVTVDEVLGVDSAANVQYDGGVARFDDQIICGPMSAGGDSGSVVYDADGNAIGLLFAGSNTVTIVNRIQDVFSEMNIDKIA